MKQRLLSSTLANFAGRLSGDQGGISVLEIFLACAILMIFMIGGLQFFANQQSTRLVARAATGRDRIIENIRAFAGMPAAIRNSARAQGPNGKINPELYICTSGNPANACNNAGNQIPFTLYGPNVALDGAGNPTIISAIATPTGSNLASRFDIYGSTCKKLSETCVLLAYTSFRPQCPSADLPSPVPDIITPEMMAPLPQCTIAEFIEVTYLIKLDPLAASKPELQAFVTGVTGTVLTPVRLISGNEPQ